MRLLRRRRRDAMEIWRAELPAEPAGRPSPVPHAPDLDPSEVDPPERVGFDGRPLPKSKGPISGSRAAVSHGHYPPEPPGYPPERVKRFHVTTFGCQMNEHDSERMKGMLESLGYREVAERADADLILFNTCSIREKADDRFVAHLHEAKVLKRRDPERVIGVGGCWAQSVKEQVFRQFPFVDVAFGPGQVHKLAEFLTSDSLTAQGYFEFEGFTGHLPGSGRASSRPGCRSRSAATALLVLHRAVHAGARSLAPARRAGGGGRARWPPTACAR